MTKFLCDNPIPFYVYKVTLRPTGQYYFGFRKRHVTEKRLPENDLWLHYFTSSNEIAELLKGYSANQFDAQIVHKGFDLDGCFWIEQELIKQHFDDSLLLNKTYHDKELGHRVFISAQEQCTFCQKTVDRGNIDRHQKSCRSNPDRVTQKRPRFSCAFCGVTRIPGSIIAHERSCSKNPNAVRVKNKSAGSDTCTYCKLSFNLIGLPKHERTCDQNLETQKTVTECPYCHKSIRAKTRSMHVAKCASKIRVAGSKQHKLSCEFCQKK
jgi:hypothetical protein